MRTTTASVAETSSSSFATPAQTLRRIAEADFDAPGIHEGFGRDHGDPLAVDCPYCGPRCIPGAAHNARMEDRCLFGSLPGELVSEPREVPSHDQDAIEYLPAHACWLPEADCLALHSSVRLTHAQAAEKGLREAAFPLVGRSPLPCDAETEFLRIAARGKGVQP